MSRHQPPTNRSFYLSVAASTIRFALIVALVVGGVVVINQAFPESASSGDGGAGVPTGGAGPGTTTGPTATTTGATGETGGEPANVASPTITGTRVGVFNGAGVTGLAADVMTELGSEGYVAGQEPTDAPAPVSVTTLYYRTNSDKVEAEYLANEFFKRLDGVNVAKLQRGSDVDPNVQVAIFLGNDYAALVA
jgi:hypothetical protein